MKKNNLQLILLIYILIILYNWIKKDIGINNVNKYLNNKIDCIIENFVIFNF